MNATARTPRRIVAISFLMVAVNLWAGVAFAAAPLPEVPATTLTVLTPTGLPAAGARAVIVPAGHMLTVTDGRSFDDDPVYRIATTDATGRLLLTATVPPYSVCVLNDHGSADFDGRSVLADGVVRLRAWGRVEGTVRVGARSVPGRTVNVTAVRWPPTGPDGVRWPLIVYQSELRTDLTGRFVADRVPPGDVEAVVHRRLTDARRIARAPIVYGVVDPGRTTTLDFGGRGRLVTGRVVVPPGLSGGRPYVIDFGEVAGIPPRPVTQPVAPLAPAGMTMAQYAEWTAAPQQVAARQEVTAYAVQRGRLSQSRTHPFDIRSDGTFSVPDVLPGEYRLEAIVAGPRRPDWTRPFFSRPTLTFTVPDDNAATRFDLGTITATPLKAEAPRPTIAFDVPGLDDRPVRSADYAGRFLLIDFWATWCGPCLAEEPNLRAVYDRFGRDPRFAMIGMCVDETPGPPIEHVRQHNIPWRHGFLGGTDGPVTRGFKIDGYPTILLIGPDGKVVADNLRGRDIEAAIEAALAGRPIE
ncbi:MAG TPA: TlpA disulfide reductase family protein [Tepidisphaeraceae bacterium]|jgi:thiol-disulfide isomerase/thioredoxin